MSYYSPSIEKLIESFEKLPSIGNKTAARLAFYILNASEEETNEFISNIQNAKKNLKYCSKCYNMSDSEICPICSNKIVLAGFNDLATTNPKLTKEWHPTLNYPLSAQQVTLGSSKKVWWQCKEGHEWIATVCNRNSGRGCDACRKIGFEKRV